MFQPQALASYFSAQNSPSHFLTKLFFCGDVMLGRGVDQILPYPTDDKLYEGYVKHAKDYAGFAEEENGPLPKNIDFSYIWGEALNVLEQEQPDVRIINLETSITHSKTPWPSKGIHYKMSPQNAPVLFPMKLDCCVLSNNHVLDWGYQGLTDTMKTLQSSNIQYCGVGENLKEAQKPVIISLPGKGRLLVFGVGSDSSGVLHEWRARKDKAGVWMADPMDQQKVKEISDIIRHYKQDDDIVVLAIHWGSNWGYDIPSQHTKFAHMLIDYGDIDIIHGHSSHHPRAVEVYKGKVIMYGCGDFINDYEGISGHEEYGKDLTFMYFITLDNEKKFHSMDLVPLKIKKIRLNPINETDFQFMKNVADEEYAKFGLSVTEAGNRRLKVSVQMNNDDL